MRKDLWLSEVTGVSCWNLDALFEFSTNKNTCLATYKSPSKLTNVQIPADTRFICTQVTYLIPPGSIVEDTSGIIQLNTPMITDAQIKYWSTLFSTDRFSLDERLPANFSSKIKYRWIADALQSSSAKAVIGYEIKRNIFAGFIVFSKESSEITIELIAVGEKFRGRGIARRLITYLSAAFGVDIRVGTQKQNEASNQLYKRLGGSVISEKYVYHRYIM